MKRSGIYLFFLFIVLCLVYGYRYQNYEKKQEDHIVEKSTQTTSGDTTEPATTQASGDSHATPADAPVRPQAAKKNSASQPTTKYILKYVDKEIVVYEADGKTIFEKTGITDTRLTEEVREQLKTGITVEDEEKLYSLLESYSS